METTFLMLGFVPEYVSTVICASSEDVADSAFNDGATGMVFFVVEMPQPFI